MLELHDIVKKYSSGDNEVLALRGVSLKFRKNEFVSILGASGCGKTTMLNIIGGLDRYTDGDLVINGVSTKAYKDRDWDTYRNHSIGFVFQSYNLIPHQTVLSNVELALTLSGVSKHERRQRAKEALIKVGLGDQLHKRPSQMSGGQMQRVAIARALVNNPDILLADEPTGALDTTTSVQIMDLLKEVASDRLVIMVTHNPELAAEYSTRIVKLSDGLVIDDTDPYEGEEVTAAEAEPTVKVKKPKKNKEKGNKAKTSMSFFTALTLSMNNLLTKKGRTTLTSFAGSIGIIGIALVLALSTGINAYIDQVQEDTLSSFPLSINKTDSDISALMNAMMQVSESTAEQEDGKIYVDNSMGTMAQAMTSTVENDLVAFKKYIEENYSSIEKYVMDIQYTYDMVMQIYSADGSTRVNPTTMFENMGDMYSDLGELMTSSGMGSFNVMSEMINNPELLKQQYEVVDGDWPTEATDVVLVISKNNQLSLMTLYMLGEVDQSGLAEIMESLRPGGEYIPPEVGPFEYSHFIGKEFRLLTTGDFYVTTDQTYVDDNGVERPVWKDIRNDPGFDQESFVTNPENCTTLKISGIIRPRDGVSATSISGAIGYTKALTDLMLEMTAQSEVIKQQKETPEYNVLTGLKFERTYYTPENFGELLSKVDKTTMETYFYPYVTKLILQGGENGTQLGDSSFGDMMNVADKASFMNVFMFTSNEYQAKCIEKMVTDAKTSNPNGLNMLCTVLTSALGGKVTVTPDNFVMLLDLINQQNSMLIMAAINGIPKSDTVPMDIKGLADLASAECMTEIYADTTAEMKNIQVDEELFLKLITFASMNDENFGESETFKTLEEQLYNLAPGIDASYDSNIKLLDDSVSSAPASINFYAKDFESKDQIKAFIEDYNQLQKNNKKDEKVIKYNDIVGTLMSSISTIINVITYVLIAFVSISLIVSSIMIGIITYISVVERTKEIGILRAIGASKRDISRVFNAETLIVGLISGIFGIATTLLLTIPINAVIHLLSGISTINAILPWQGALILVAISITLTIVAGLFPSRVASKKDPVEALRSE